MERSVCTLLLMNTSTNLCQINIQSAPFRRVCLPNFIPLGLRVGLDKLPTNFGRKRKRKTAKTMNGVTTEKTDCKAEVRRLAYASRWTNEIRLLGGTSVLDVTPVYSFL